MVKDMYWAKCPECPPGEKYTHIPENSDICISCMEEKFGVEHETPGEASSAEELQEMVDQAKDGKKTEFIKMLRKSRSGTKVAALPPSHRGDDDG